MLLEIVDLCFVRCPGLGGDPANLIVHVPLKIPMGWKSALPVRVCVVTGISLKCNAINVALALYIKLFSRYLLEKTEHFFLLFSNTFR